jgi:Na+-translocating ferredoxin:NAD+ oxidoreductase RnfE subunit
MQAQKSVTYVIHVYQCNCHCSTMVLYVGVNYFTCPILNCVIIEKAEALAAKRNACSPIGLHF